MDIHGYLFGMYHQELMDATSKTTGFTHEVTRNLGRFIPNSQGMRKDQTPKILFKQFLNICQRFWCPSGVHLILLLVVPSTASFGYVRWCGQPNHKSCPVLIKLCMFWNTTTAKHLQSTKFVRSIFKNQLIDDQAHYWIDIDTFQSQTQPTPLEGVCPLLVAKTSRFREKMIPIRWPTQPLSPWASDFPLKLCVILFYIISTKVKQEFQMS